MRTSAGKGGGWWRASLPVAKANRDPLYSRVTKGESTGVTEKQREERDSRHPRAPPPPSAAGQPTQANESQKSETVTTRRNRGQESRGEQGGEEFLGSVSPHSLGLAELSGDFWRSLTFEPRQGSIFAIGPSTFFFSIGPSAARTRHATPSTAQRDVSAAPAGRPMKKRASTRLSWPTL